MLGLCGNRNFWGFLWGTHGYEKIQFIMGKYIRNEKNSRVCMEYENFVGFYRRHMEMDYF